MKIAVYGASGYTGRLIVAELSRRGLDTVLIGRSPRPGHRVAALDDERALTSALEDCDVVINCAGPFVRWGRPVVRAAIDVGTQYVDISGEQDHLLRTFDEADAAARAAGITVLPGANDDALPSDLLAAVVAKALPEPVDALTIAVRLDGDGGLPSGGTMRSVLASQESFLGGGVAWSDGSWQRGLPFPLATVEFPGEPPVEVAPFALPAVVSVPRHVDARHVGGAAPTSLVASFTGVTPELVASLPVDGPSPEQRAAGRWTLVVRATGRSGAYAEGVVGGPDTYGITAVIAVEAAIRLVAGGAPAGVVAPAQAFEPAGFLDALSPWGVRWSIPSRPS